jgi:uncharacterized RDD family membrane protein YckC
MMPASLNFRAAMPMVVGMNAIAQVSAAPVSGSKLDNRRVMAAIVDLLIVTAGAVAVLLAGESLTGDRQSALGAVILGWALYYFFALESGGGQTIGKKLMKLRVVRADGRGAGMREIAVRTILRVVDNYLVGLIVMLATGERRQRVGDLAAGTIVVDASALAAVPPPAPVPDVVAEDEPAGDEPSAEAESQPAPSETITLPARPAPPATLSGLTEPEEAAEREPEPVDNAPAVPEPRLFQPVEDPIAHAAPEVEEVAQADEIAQADSADAPPEDDGPVNVKSVETVSAMDLIMGAAEEDASGQGASHSAEDADDSASR